MNLKDRIHQQHHDPSFPKPIKVGLEDIDGAILYYFKNVIKPYVIQNGMKVDVPVIYGNPERWTSVQKNGYYRDGASKIMAPFLMFKRTNLEKRRGITDKIDANLPRNYIIYSQKYNKRNIYDNFNVLNSRTPEETYHVTVVPDFVNVEYECVIITYYIDQLNKLIEAINYASDSYWGNPETFKFKTQVSNFNTPVEIIAEGERSVRASFTLSLFGHIIPDSINKELNSIKTLHKKTKIRIRSEIVEDVKTPPIKPYKYIPTRYVVKNITQPYPIQVELGTKIYNIGLPTYLTVGYGDGKTSNVDVDWEDLGYNKDERGQYTFLAKYLLPVEVTGQKPTIFIRVQVGEGMVVDPDEYLKIENRLSEFDTPEAKKEARINIDLQIIDEGEY